MKIMLCLAILLASALAYANDDQNPQVLTDQEIAKIEKQLDLDLKGVYQTAAPISDDERKVIEQDVAQAAKRLDELARRTDASLDTLVKLASWALKRRGYPQEAERIRREYDRSYTHAVYDFSQDIVPVDIGDHAPLNEWLDTWFAKVSRLLGPLVMRITKLEYLDLLNHEIPVVFHPRGWKGDSWDMLEYRKHFAGTRTKLFYPLDQKDGAAGIVVWLAVFASCAGATYGSGVIVFMCSPLAELSDFASEKWVLPSVSDWVFCKATDNGAGCPSSFQ